MDRGAACGIVVATLLIAALGAPAVVVASAPTEAGPRRDEILLRPGDGRDVVALRLGTQGPVAIRHGSVGDAPIGEPIDADDVTWQLPVADAVYLDGGWWSPLASAGHAAGRLPDDRLISEIRETIAPADDGRGRDRLYRAVLGDVIPDGEIDLVVAFRRPFQRTFINATRPARFWRDRAGMSAHLGIYDPATLRPRWVAGTLVHPVVDLAVCDGHLAVAYGRLDRRGVAETGSWRWQGFGFVVSEALPGGGEPACVDVDGDGRLDPAILGRDGS
jgi:hypothetical protein